VLHAAEGRDGRALGKIYFAGTDAFGAGDNPSRDVFKTKADVVKFVQEAFADGAKVIQQQGDAGLSKSTRLHLATFGVAHAFDHYGQVVEYLRMNGIVAPASRGKSE
jgi:hypothetical protein